MKLKLKEFRFQSNFELEVSNRLINMLNHIAHLYYSITDEIVLDNTNILLISILDNNEKIDEKKILGLLGSKESGYIGGFGMKISKKKLLELNDTDKRIYLLTNFQKALFNFLDNYHFENKKICFEQSFYIIIDKFNFWRKYTKEYISRNKKFSCQIESRVCWGSEEFRIIYKNFVNDSYERIYITKKIITFFSELDVEVNTPEFMHLLLSTPQTFTDFKLKNSLFEFCWGNEKYIFNVENKQITINNK